MAIPDNFELANDSEFRLLANFSAPPRAGRISTIEPSGQVRVETDDPDGGDVLAWPLNGFSYAVNDVVYIAFAANSPDTAIVIGAKAPLPTLDAGVLPEAYVPTDGSDPLTADWDIGEDRRIKAEALRARDGEGLKLEDDAGNVGLQLLDGGNIKIPLVLVISGGTQDYNIFNGITDDMVFKAMTAGKAVNVKFETADGDGTDGVVMTFYAEGGALSGSYRSRLIFGYEPSVGAYRWFSEAQGAGTLLPLLFYTEGNDNQLRLATNGNNGMGVASPQGKLHVHDGTGGLIFVTKSAISNVAQTIIADGAGDVTRGITGFIVIYDGTSTVANAITMLPGDNVDVAIGSYTMRLALNVNGALTAVRQAGSGTASLALMGVWM